MEVMPSVYEKTVLFFFILIQICHILVNVFPDTFIHSDLMTSVLAFLFL